jgi:2',3'-cyclic-nucleotide 2'-phosphodiesterase (5'-nucleotidase family)
MTKVDSEYTVGGTAALLGYINKFKSESSNVLVLNAGDDFQGTPISTFTFGRSQVELMNVIHPDATTLGNHEFDYGANKLRENLKLAAYPVLVANLFDERRNSTFSQPSKIVTVGRLKIGLIGLTHPQLESLVIKDSLVATHLLSIDSVLTWHIAQFKQQRVNLIVAITHIGLANDSAIAQNHPELDIIISGHDHRALPVPRKVNRSIIVQAEKWGRFLGKLDVMVDVTGDSVYSYTGKLVETRTAGIVPDPRAAKKVRELTDGVQKAMSEVIGELRTPWQNHESGRRESNIGDWQCDVFLEYAKADVAFQNTTGIRKSLQAGAITLGDVWEMNPFGNYCISFGVDGKRLRSMVEFQVSEASGQEWLQVGGIRYVYDSRKAKGQRVVSIEVGGRPLDERRQYVVVTNNYVASNASVHFGIDSKTLQLTAHPKLDRDILIERIQRDKSIVSTADGRIKNLAEQK